MSSQTDEDVETGGVLTELPTSETMKIARYPDVKTPPLVPNPAPIGLFAFGLTTALLQVRTLVVKPGVSVLSLLWWLVCVSACSVTYH